MSEVEAGTDVPPEGEASPSPHSTSVVVWDAPSTVECGETFSVKLGVKCSAECRPDGWTVEVLDHDGTVRATAAPSDEPWRGTTALYFAEVELSAPDTDGLYSWEAKALGAGLVDDLDVPHAERIVPFGVRVVPTPECVLTVVACIVFGLEIHLDGSEQTFRCIWKCPEDGLRTENPYFGVS